MTEDLRIFVSWSGDASLKIARSISALLETGSDRFETFISSENIRSGQRWLTVVNEELARARAGLIIVTPDNQSRPWLNFESGAIANAVDIPNARVIPLLCGIERSAVDSESPLRQFQMHEVTEEGLTKVIKDLAVMAGVDPNTVLARARSSIGSVVREAHDIALNSDNPYVPTTPINAMVEEILVIVRALANSGSEDDVSNFDFENPQAAVRAVNNLLARSEIKAAVHLRKVAHGEAAVLVHEEPLPRGIMVRLHEIAWSYRATPIYLERRIRPIRPASIDTSDPEHMKY